MDTLTHALSGALLGKATSGIDGSALPLRRRIWFGFFAAAFPDIDFLLRPFVEPITFLTLHRGVTHSILLLPFWALLLAFMGGGPSRKFQPRDYLPLAIMSLAIHIAADVITAYGTMIFAPFSDYKASIPTTFIIDPWFTGILLAGLALSRLFRSSRLPAVASLIVLAGYVGYQYILQNSAKELGWQHARNQGLASVRVTALPQPLSPFNWNVFIESGETYLIAAVNLRRDQALPPADGFINRLVSSYRPPDDLRWRSFSDFGQPEERPLALAAWQSKAMDDYRGFARFPHLLGLDRAENAVCAWFVDLRFTLGDPTLIERTPFKFGACRSHEDDEWRLHRHDDPPAPFLEKNNPV
jgi:inner membrane protein